MSTNLLSRMYIRLLDGQTDAPKNELLKHIEVSTSGLEIANLTSSC
jgi:hypothetical protein